MAKKTSSSQQEQLRNEKEYQNRLIVAKALKDYLKAEIAKVLPEVKANHWSYPYHFENVPYKNKVPDLLINHKFWEVESYEGKFRISKLGRMIKGGQKQADYVAIKLNHFVKIETLERQIKRLENTERFKWEVKRLVIVDPEGKVIYDKITTPK